MGRHVERRISPREIFQAHLHSQSGPAGESRLIQKAKCFFNLRPCGNLSRQDRPLVHRLEGLDFSPAPVRWIREGESGIHGTLPLVKVSLRRLKCLLGLSCLMGKSLRVFAPPSFYDSSNDLRVNRDNNYTVRALMLVHFRDSYSPSGT